jgi:hypothetical protein
LTDVANPSTTGRGLVNNDKPNRYEIEVEDVRILRDREIWSVIQWSLSWLVVSGKLEILLENRGVLNRKVTQ